MKVSLSWLREFAAITSGPSEIAEKLTMTGLEVESFNDRFSYLDKVVVARVKTVEKHPEADHLSCCTVDAGGESLSIVCGAPNVRAGMLTPCALVGAELPGDFVIKKSKLRGAVSEGMLCSAAELRLDSDASGIMDLGDRDLMPGTPISQALSLMDPVFEIDLTPNRPDCLSVIGIAREVAAFQDPPVRLTLPVSDLPQGAMGDVSIHDMARVDILDPELCPRYSAGLLLDVKVGPSPAWLAQRLEAVGLTPINNIVDVTNYIMMETGQPLHAFDFDFLAQGRIEVKRAGGPISFTTLDSKNHVLEPDMLMICDGERSVAMAGVMGGENSEILDSTTRVLIESAYFNPISIRKTAKRSGISTDASHRFERGIDPEGTVTALKRAMAMMADFSGGTMAQGIIDERPLASPAVEIRVSPAFLNSRLGTQLSGQEIRGLLESVAFGVDEDGQGNLVVRVPSFRVDVSRPEDISEEVARLWGYNNIKTSFPAIPARRQRVSPRITLRRSIRDIMNGFGFSEAVNYSFTSPRSCDNLCLGPQDPRRSVESILNPISEDMAVLRTSLLPQLLETMRRNISQQTDSLRLFECGNVFFATEPGKQPVETEMLAGMWTGSRTPGSWHSKPQSCDFFDLKGVVQGLFAGLHVDGIGFSQSQPSACPYFKTRAGAVMTCGSGILGSIGQVHPQVMKNFGLKQDVFVFEIDMGMLLSLVPESLMTGPLPRYPSIARDITIIVDADTEAGAVMAELCAFKGKESLMEDVLLFDVYQGAPLKQGKKSLSFRIVYRSWEKTLKEKMIKGLHDHVSRTLIEKFKADLPA
ncbi:MAG: phenylalanine--tRNA ligase subunit beta [Pseudomonadota bacterium]